MGSGIYNILISYSNCTFKSMLKMGHFLRHELVTFIIYGLYYLYQKSWAIYLRTCYLCMDSHIVWYIVLPGLMLFTANAQTVALSRRLTRWSVHGHGLMLTWPCLVLLTWLSPARTLSPPPLSWDRRWRLWHRWRKNSRCVYSFNLTKSNLVN